MKKAVKINLFISYLILLMSALSVRAAETDKKELSAAAMTEYVEKFLDHKRDNQNELLNLLTYGPNGHFFLVAAKILKRKFNENTNAALLDKNLATNLENFNYIVKKIITITEKHHSSVKERKKKENTARDILLFIFPQENKIIQNKKLLYVNEMIEGDTALTILLSILGRKEFDSHLRPPHARGLKSDLLVLIRGQEDSRLIELEKWMANQVDSKNKDCLALLIEAVGLLKNHGGKTSRQLMIETYNI